ncbi:MAG: HmuY family protein [Saprospiraceae bacterium]|nr:HmuY family protein [Saprospiraceae bacterium]
MFNVFLFLSFLFLISCDKTENNVDTSTLRTVTIKDLAADPTTGFDPNNGMPIGDTKRFTFFRFSDSSIVANTDSATTTWDIGFRASTIIVNSGISGPGSAAKCSDGKYAKIELLSYYKGSPVAPDAFKDQARYYTFRYVYQSNGSKNLNKE